MGEEFIIFKNTNKDFWGWKALIISSHVLAFLIAWALNPSLNATVALFIEVVIIILSGGLPTFFRIILKESEQQKGIWSKLKCLVSNWIAND